MFTSIVLALQANDVKTLVNGSETAKAKVVNKSKTSTTTQANVAISTSSSTTPVSQAASGAIATTSATAQAHSYGIAGGGLWIWQDPSNLKDSMDNLADLGVRWLRFDMTWDSVQGVSAQQYQWQAYDNLVKLANERHIQLLPILVRTPAWARDPACSSSYLCQPAKAADFANFSAAAAKRYAPLGVHSWEIWNEPNKQREWKPAPNPSAYKTVLQASYTAIKAADPSATVMSGGLGGADANGVDYSPINFLTGLYQSGGKSYLDAVSLHPYSFPVLASYGAVWNGWQQMANAPSSIRGVMLANGDTAKKIWITEYGAPTNGPGGIADIGNYNFRQNPNHVTEALQNMTVIDVVAQYKTLDYVGPFFWYSLKDSGNNVNNKEDYFGLLRSDGTKKPAYDTYKWLVRSSQ